MIAGKKERETDVELLVERLMDELLKWMKKMIWMEELMRMMKLLLTEAEHYIIIMKRNWIEVGIE